MIFKKLNDYKLKIVFENCYYIATFNAPHPSGTRAVFDNKWILNVAIWHKSRNRKPVINKRPRYKRVGVFGDFRSLFLHIAATNPEAFSEKEQEQ